MKSFAEQVKISLHKKAKMILHSAALRLQRLQQLQVQPSLTQDHFR